MPRRRIALAVPVLLAARLVLRFAVPGAAFVAADFAAYAAGALLAAAADARWGHRPRRQPAG